jgi:hypothetical protein
MLGERSQHRPHEMLWRVFRAKTKILVMPVCVCVCVNVCVWGGWRGLWGGCGTHTHTHTHTHTNII